MEVGEWEIYEVMMIMILNDDDDDDLIADIYTETLIPSLAISTCIVP